MCSIVSRDVLSVFMCQMMYQCNLEKMFVENIAKTVWV